MFQYFVDKTFELLNLLLCRQSVKTVLMVSMKVSNNLEENKIKAPCSFKYVSFAKTRH